MQKPLLICLLWLTAGLIAAAAEGSGLQAGKVLTMQVAGVVTAVNKEDASERVLANGAQVTQAEIVKTAAESSVVLVFGNGSTVRLGEDSELDIEEFLQEPFSQQVSAARLTTEPSRSKTRLHLRRGELIGNVKKLDTQGGSSFIVKTPVGAAGIRGTTFRILFRLLEDGRYQFSLTTQEGLVEWATGEIGVPVPVGENLELAVEVHVDPATGQVVWESVPETLVPQEASVQAQQAIAAAVQEVLEAVADLIIPSLTGPGDGNPNSSDNSDAGDNSSDPPPPPPPLPPPPRTTSGDGID